MKAEINVITGFSSAGIFIKDIVLSTTADEIEINVPELKSIVESGQKALKFIDEINDSIAKAAKDKELDRAVANLTRELEWKGE